MSARPIDRKRAWGYNRVCLSGMPCVVPHCAFVDTTMKHESSAMFCSRCWVHIDKDLRNQWRHAKTEAVWWRLTHKMIGQAIMGAHFDHRIRVGVPA